MQIERVEPLPVTTFYDFSGGMESAAALVIDRERIRETSAIVRFADTGKQFPEMTESIAQISSLLGVEIVTVPRRITFDEYLFERGGMLRKGLNDCSRRMKRGNLKRHAATFPKPWEINLGFNADEDERAEAFSARNERSWCHWRYPLIEAGVTREMSWTICRDAGFSILVAMYKKMGRFDCFFCPNQKPSQAVKVYEHYPELAAEWIEIEKRKGHSILPIPLAEIVAVDHEERRQQPTLWECSCFGGTDDVWEDDSDEATVTEART